MVIPIWRRVGCVLIAVLCTCSGYLKKQDIPLVIVSHDREFLDQLCTKIVETEHGKATSYKGNYTQYVAAKAEKVALQWAAFEKQQKEIARQVGQVWAKCMPAMAAYKLLFRPVCIVL